MSPSPRENNYKPERTMEDVSSEAPDLKNNARKSTRGKHGGRRSGAGRKKGTPNKLTADVKAAIMEAFCEAGGAEYLRKISKPPACVGRQLQRFALRSPPRSCRRAFAVLWCTERRAGSTQGDGQLLMHKGGAT